VETNRSFWICISIIALHAIVCFGSPVQFQGIVLTDEQNDVFPVCYGDYFVEVSINTILSDPQNSLDGLSSVRVCYSPAMGLKSGDQVEINGDRCDGTCPLQMGGVVSPYNGTSGITLLSSGMIDYQPGDRVRRTQDHPSRPTLRAGATGTIVCKDSSFMEYPYLVSWDNWHDSDFTASQFGYCDRIVSTDYPLDSLLWTSGDVMEKVTDGGGSNRIVYVDASAGPGGNGATWAGAYRYLQDALAVAQSGDEIRVAQGIYMPDQGTNVTRGDRSATFTLASGVALYGGYAGRLSPNPNARDAFLYHSILNGDLNSNDPNYLIVDVNDAERAENSYHVVTAEETGPTVDSTAILDGFTVTGGNANRPYNPEISSHRSYGGGLHNHGSPTITNCRFLTNSATFAGAIYTGDGHPTIKDCLFTYNSAQMSGGGVANYPDSTAHIENCRFENNTGEWGGGMYCRDCAPIITHCDFSSNTATTSGGGIYNYTDSTARIENCRFENNTAEWGGGIYNRYGRPTIVSCDFLTNGAMTSGGGIYSCNSSHPNIVSCYFRSNSATYGGGLYNGTESLNVSVSNCVFVQNAASQYGGAIRNNETQGTCKITNCTVFFNTASIGGGICNNEDVVNIANTILYNNHDGSASTELAQVEDGVVTVNYCCIQGLTGLLGGIGNIDRYPDFIGVTEINGNHIVDLGNVRLSSDSPCIDAGSNARIPQDLADVDHDGNFSEKLPWDREGNLRIQGSSVDMGAYEY